MIYLPRFLTSVARAAAVCAPALLAACGGGGGDSAPSAPQATPLALSSSNQNAVAGQALVSISGSNPVAALGSGSQVIFAARNLQQGANSTPAMLAAIAQKFTGPRARSAAAAQAASTTTDTLACDNGGGSLTITANAANDATVTVGDYAVLSANNCQTTLNGATVVMGGSLKLTYQGGNGATSYPITTSMAVIATNFSVTSAGLTSTVNGDMLMNLSQNSDVAVTMDFSGSALTTSVSDGTTIRSTALKNYTQHLSSDGTGTTTNSTNATIEVNDPLLGTGLVSYQVTTVQPVVTDPLGEYTAGQVSITGDHSALILNVTGTNTFDLQLDANGDGTYELDTTPTLSDLFPQTL